MKKIMETNDMWEVAFEKPLDYLELEMPEVDPSLRGGVIDRPMVTLGKPNFWKLNISRRNQKTTLKGQSEFLLTRLAFSIRTLKNPIESAILSVKLSSNSDKVPTAFDLFPRNQLIDQSTNIKLIIGPEFKFLELLEISLGKAEVLIENIQVIPIVESFGIGESETQWVFRNHPKYPLRGIRTTYLIIEKPLGQMKGTMKLDVAAEVKTHLGLKRASLKAEQGNLSWPF